MAEISTKSMREALVSIPSNIIGQFSMVT